MQWGHEDVLYMQSSTKDNINCSSERVLPGLLVGDYNNEAYEMCTDGLNTQIWYSNYSIVCATHGAQDCSLQFTTEYSRAVQTNSFFVFCEMQDMFSKHMKKLVI